MKKIPQNPNSVGLLQERQNVFNSNITRAITIDPVAGSSLVIESLTGCFFFRMYEKKSRRKKEFFWINGVNLVTNQCQRRFFFRWPYCFICDFWGKGMSGRYVAKSWQMLLLIGKKREAQVRSFAQSCSNPPSYESYLYIIWIKSCQNGVTVDHNG